MQYGLSLPPFGDFAYPHVLIDAAKRAEAAGWDGFFLWDHVIFDQSFRPNLDPWIALAAVAMVTTRMRIGTLITPLARRRPWKLARETVTLDRLSNGRLTLGVGLGSTRPFDFGYFGEESDPKTRARMLDEGLEVLTGLWSGAPFRFDGTHYHLEEVTFQPAPIQQPRIPIWVAGVLPHKPPMRRAALWDGFVPIKDGELEPEDCREVMTYIRQFRSAETPFDLACMPLLPADPVRAKDRLGEFADAGMTWWIAPIDPWALGADRDSAWKPAYTEQMLDWIDRGPIQL